MIRTIGRSIVAAVVLTVGFGLIYPLVMTGIAQVAFKNAANGSLITVNGHVVGSKLAAQDFTKPQYFHERPSATAPAYNAAATTFSNLGPTSSALRTQVRSQIRAILKLERPYNPGLTVGGHPRRRGHDQRLGHRPRHLAGLREPAGAAGRGGASPTTGDGQAPDLREHRRPLDRRVR